MDHEYMENRRSRFERTYRRPLPWFEYADLDHTASLIALFRERLHLGRGDSVLETAWERMNRYPFPGINWLLLRGLGAEPDDLVVICDFAPIPITCNIKLRAKDAADFWEVLRPRGVINWLFCEQAHWMVAEHHEPYADGLRTITFPKARG